MAVVTWRTKLAAAQQQLVDARVARDKLFHEAVVAGFTLRQIGEASGLTGAAVYSAVGRRSKISLDEETG